MIISRQTTAVLEGEEEHYLNLLTMSRPDEGGSSQNVLCTCVNAIINLVSLCLKSQNTSTAFVRHLALCSDSICIFFPLCYPFVRSVVLYKWKSN